MSDVQNHNLDVSGAEEQGEGTELDAQWDDCSKSEDAGPSNGGGGDSSLDPSPNAKDQVLTSDDILPIILRHLKDDLDKLDPAIGSGASQVRKGWKGAIASLLPVNGTFFHSGVNMLWHTMDSIVPVLKLLPWYKSPYKGVGGFAYSGRNDWKQVTEYATRIQQFDLQTRASCDIDLLWLVELLTLHERPDPFFPHLQAVSFSPDACRTLRILMFLMCPSLESLVVHAGSEVRGYESYPDDWRNSDRRSHVAATQLLQDNVLASFPKLSSSSTRLRSLTYRGPTNKEILERISNIGTITFLDLTLTAQDDSDHCLRDLRKLPLLQSLVVTALPYQTYANDKVTMLALRCGRLTSLHITAMEGQMVGLLFGILAPHPTKIRDLTLNFIRINDQSYFYRSIEEPTRGNTFLEIITVQSVAPAGQQLFETHSWQWTPQSFFEMSESNVKSNFKIASNIKAARFIDMPPILWRSLSSVLRASIPHWKLLTTLIFTIQAGIGDEAANNAIPINGFPGLSFLASGIWNNCPNLEILIFQFDEDKVILEDLTSILSTSYQSAASTLERYPTGHPLRELTVNTGVGEGSGTLALDLPRKVQIVTFLDKLFPNLVEVKGSATTVWEEIGTWVAAYQELKDDFCAQIEAL
ncbi:hypothetical protein D9611_011190 [Ephemerocybe angulata]|uniref:Uncharacterized protein n=1 Tax=Ephemerocybe angulata TaxID=980116 RepID=A0A8H5CCF7_9AGAR|nr:hypothetical protein D9611_011190 [Tulosesus angulatus]